MLQIIQRIGRSDHLPMLKLMYQQYFLPLYYTLTTIPFDSPDKIDYVKLTKMTKWIYETGWRVAQSAKRPALTIEIKSKK
jgi:hypothetical protein